MPNNPVQIVLNDSAFLRMKDSGRGGDPKDFFAGNDQAFIRHRGRLIGTLRGIKEELQSSSYGGATFIRVRMRQQDVDATAKSYRPNRALFTQDLFPCVGAGAVGELYYRVALYYIDHLIAAFEKAEDTPPFKTRKGELKQVASQNRSEVGAIASISVQQALEKIRFDIDDAVESFQQSSTISGYRLELFEKGQADLLQDDTLAYRELQRTFVESFMELGNGVRGYLARTPGIASLMEFQIREDTGAPPLLVNQSGAYQTLSTLKVADAEPVREPVRHRDALLKLAKHPLVKAIRPPLRMSLSEAPADTDDSEPLLTVEPPQADATYPLVGVIDSGVTAPSLQDWVIGRYDYLDEDDYDGDHGSRVSGILVAGGVMNDGSVTPEPVGCKIYDIPIFPEAHFLDVYPNGFEEIFEQIAGAVELANDEGVRVFNMSLNMDEVSPTEYGVAAARIDEISDTHDVVFVISAGNLDPEDHRTPWHTKPSDVVNYFAGRTATDAIQQPAESVRSLSVGALNPPGQSDLEDAPTIYTRRGPGLQVGLKPDLCAYGGSGRPIGEPTGLNSCCPEDRISPVNGTSYAAPLVARTLAEIDHVTRGQSSKETLRALMIHHAEMPHPLTRQRVSSKLGPQFGGFGKAPAAADLLQTTDHAITFVFESRLTILEPRPAMLDFQFTWPQALVNEDGSCRGQVRATLVYSPPLDPAFGAEFVRVNLNASLKQRVEYVDEDGVITEKWESRLQQRNLAKSPGAGFTERALIKHGLKWWPTKKYGVKFRDAGKGNTSDWKIVVDSLIRAETSFPAQGVPFSLVITIEDPDGAAPIFSELQRSLSLTAQMIDIRSRARVQVR